MPSAPNTLLFYGKDLPGLIRALPDRIRQEVEGWDKNRILGTSESDLIEYIVEKHSFDPPSIQPGDVHIESEGETQIDVSGRFDYHSRDDGRPNLVPGCFVTIAIPFTGDAALFGFQASTSTLNPPRGTVEEGRLLFTFRDVKLAPDRIRSEIDKIIKDVDGQLGWIRKDCDAWNRQVATVAARCIQNRKERLLQQSNLVQSLGLPIKRRAEVSETFNVPVSRRKRPVSLPPAPKDAFKPEPALPDDEYDYILNVVDQLSKSIERSRRTFLQMEEEQVRDLILVSLNGHYEGGATGETFNAEGKTDISIQADGRNVFIAECKFWTGPKGLLAAIDQLLSYLTWRDTKTALIMFSKNADFTNVLKVIQDTVKTHPNFKRGLGKKSETHFRYAFSQNNDPARSLYLAVLSFDLPRGN